MWMRDCVQARLGSSKLSLSLIPGAVRDSGSYRDSGGHHAVLVPHQPAGHAAHGPLPGLAVPGHLPQLPHLEGQS